MRDTLRRRHGFPILLKSTYRMKSQGIQQEGKHAHCPLPKARRYLRKKCREDVKFPGWGALWVKLSKSRFIHLKFPFHCKSKFAICRIKKCESIIFVRSFENGVKVVVKVNQVEDKNQNWENHPAHLREGAHFHLYQIV